jgi:hypothetical protein
MVIGVADSGVSLGSLSLTCGNSLTHSATGLVLPAGVSSTTSCRPDCLGAVILTRGADSAAEPTGSSSTA